VDVGVERDAAIRLNQPFLTAVRLGRPFVVMKVASSQDGYMAAGRGQRTPLTSPPALKHAHLVRAQVDAIGIGSETLLVDDPLLTAREVYRERPLTRVVFDRRLRLPATSRLFSTLETGPVIVMTSADAVRSERAFALEQIGARVMAQGADFSQTLRCLVPLGIQSLVLEGGAALHAAAWEEGLIDYVQMYVAPVSLGREGVPTLLGREFSTASLVESKTTALGPDLLVEGYVHGPH
jgi:diaminohydroxyphosphoribosylaminopyrimidine deaminase/5-amino-6-(5-phosphoribosylamino)uracil reductase